MLGIHVVYKLVSITFSLLAIWTSISIFNKGFLLTRYELNETNKCENPPKCWERKELPYNKVILLIIDALRYDFTTLSDKNATYLNKMPVFHDIALNKGCAKTKLFRFEADAPTTTMQRIKGMFTGGFPTFIDVSNNFASGEIMEDNVLDQLGGNITFMGDDTWVGLFPERFQRSFPFPSFDVKDLHTVDNGVLNHLFDEIPKQDWRLLIAHFLGVDHCGHRYGPLHPEMSLKLAQMDQMIRDVIHTMDNNTLLLVMGDHGKL
uniref:Uncharacterized protein n=1 Tax=Ciona savignyi TaxID=51511 RepID=H2Y686_CIOSA